MKHLKDFADTVPEYRRTGKGNYRHKLADILMLVIMARLSKCLTRSDILAFGRRHLTRLQSMGMFRHGLPSEATLCRVFQGMDHEKTAERMAAFADVFRKEAVRGGTEIICIDGKAMRGTSYENGRTPDIVSAYSPQSGITLATDICQEKSNEITSVPKLLDKLDIRGCIITADAMSFQKAIVDKIREKGGDFVIELKANQRSLRYGLEDAIKTASPMDIYREPPTLEHGRIESRACRIYEGAELIADREKWNGDLTVIEILTSTEKKSNGSHASERRLYISSMKADAGTFNKITRLHWSIESMHWCLDRNLRQDAIKRKTEQSARNLDTVQRMVLAIISAWKSRRKKAADKRKGVAGIIRGLATGLTKLLRFLAQK